MNEKINELYNKLDAQDEIIEQQIAIINEQKKKIDKAIKYIKSNYDVLLLSNPPKKAFDKNELLEILGDKE